MSKIILLDGRVAQSPEQVMQYVDRQRKHGKPVKRIRWEITEQGKRELEAHNARLVKLEAEVSNG